MFHQFKCSIICDAPALPCRSGLRLFLPLPIDIRLWGSICLCLLFSVQPLGGAELHVKKALAVEKKKSSVNAAIGLSLTSP